MMTVYMIGFMGSGKSTLGRQLALQSGWQFRDLDLLIEKAEGRTVPQIFKESGEEYFRKIEAAVLRNMPAGTDTVVACGGGTPCYKDNMEYMNRSGITIYLKLDARLLTERLLKAKKIRPLIRKMKPDELEKYVNDLLDSREDYYNRASLIVDGLVAAPDKLRSLIISYDAYNKN